ncbi:uncharacterized protein LY89DRAFT_736543 [Mollisia scopiformis]|uniref:Uncharacterized protein n=1 Tax=Mollisia scopiformis TaxID=149040 RepID=A0A194X2U7_MOLSC|nr:uncharacterized protein LY89DRAFT_736543 [Mollisia scopiformis]KUJ14510.1 hypothetical protein LY89DRAFT_736543 [Mollisia scopiformis]
MDDNLDDEDIKPDDSEGATKTPLSTAIQRISPPSTSIDSREALDADESCTKCSKPDDQTDEVTWVSGHELATITNWPRSPMRVGEIKRKLLEICCLVFLALIAVMILCEYNLTAQTLQPLTFRILVFALLSASVHDTYPGRMTRYFPGKPVMLTNISNINGTDHDVFLGSSGNFDYIPIATHNLNHRVLQAAKLSPTICPIAFSAIVGSFLRNLSHWKAQKGSKLQTLELLINSRSLFNTISTTVALQSLQWLNIILILLWCLSPLAGQASLRILETRQVSNAQYSIPWSVLNIVDTGANDSSYTGMADKALDLQQSWLLSLTFGAQNQDQLFSKSNISDMLFPVLPIDGSNMDRIMEGGLAPLNLSSFAGAYIYCGLNRMYQVHDTLLSRYIAICSGNLTYPVWKRIGWSR